MNIIAPIKDGVTYSMPRADASHLTEQISAWMMVMCTRAGLLEDSFDESHAYHTQSHALPWK